MPISRNSLLFAAFCLLVLSCASGPDPWCQELPALSFTNVAPQFVMDRIQDIAEESGSQYAIQLVYEHNPAELETGITVDLPHGITVREAAFLISNILDRKLVVRGRVGILANFDASP